jgi:hypothetical protein
MERGLATRFGMAMPRLVGVKANVTAGFTGHVKHGVKPDGRS